MELIIFIIIVIVVVYSFTKYKKPQRKSKNTVMDDGTDDQLDFNIDDGQTVKEEETYKIGRFEYNRKATDKLDEETIEFYNDGNGPWIATHYRGRYYSYNFEEGFWANPGGAFTKGPPSGKNQILKCMAKNISKLMPPDLPANYIKTTYRYRGKKSYNIKGELMDKDGNMDYFDAQISYDKDPVVTLPYFFGDYGYTATLDEFGKDLPFYVKHMEAAYKQWLTEEIQRME